MSQKKQTGVGLVGVMVMVAILGILSVAVARLFSNMAEGMMLVELRSERSRLMQHYSEMIHTGWDATNTKKCGSAGNFCGGSGGSTVVIPKSGLYLGHDLFDYGNTDSDGKWWKVTATFVADSTRWDQNTTRVVKLRVEFLHQQHPAVKKQIAPVEDLILIKSIENIINSMY